MFGFKWNGKVLDIFSQGHAFDLAHWLGTDRWQCFLARTKVGAVVRGFIDKDYGPLPIHASVVNSDTNLNGVALLEANGFEYPVSAQSGLGWTDPAWMALQGSGVSTPLDGKLLAGVGDAFGLGGDVDPDVTKNTGSAGRELHLVANVIADKWGVSNALLRRLDQYRLEQIRRPRQWWNPNTGLPELGNPTRIDGVVVSPKLSFYDTWFVNLAGMNGWDLEHLDAKELYSGWVLTGDPAYLWELLGLYAHVRAHEPRVQRKPGQTYGPWRAWAYWVELCVLVLAALDGLPPVPWEEFAAEVEADLEFALARWDELAPWTYDEGSVPAEAKLAGYVMPWQRATEAHALQLGRDLLDREDMGARADAVLALEDAFIPSGSDVHDYWRVPSDPSLNKPGLLTGTGLWMLSPYVESEEFRDSDYCKAAIAKVKAAGYTKTTSYYHFVALSMLGKWTYEV